jgi:hypothetical protein
MQHVHDFLIQRVRGNKGNGSNSINLIRTYHQRLRYTIANSNLFYELVESLAIRSSTKISSICCLTRLSH